MNRSVALVGVDVPSCGRRGMGVAALGLALLAGCGTSRPADLRTISATVSGLVGMGLVLQVNGIREIPVRVNGPMALAYMPSGAHYTVAVKTQPNNPTQTCMVDPEAGEIGSMDVTEIAVSCVTTYAVGGTVTGLEGTGLVLHSSLGDDLPVAATAGSFVFPTRGPAGTEYVVTVGSQPNSPQQLCTVNSEKGTVVDADLLDVKVTCSTRVFTVSGMVTNLATDSTLLLQNNSADDREVKGSDGSFSFSVADGADYRVTVKTQPTRPWQTCTVQSGSGTIRGAPVDSVLIACVENSRVIRGSISGLQGTGLRLRLLLDGDREDTCSTDNGCIDTQGSFVFAGKGLAGSTYAVTVAQQPSSPAQNCSLANGSGTIGMGDVTNVTVVCSTNKVPNSDFSGGFPTTANSWVGGWYVYLSTAELDVGAGSNFHVDWTLRDVDDLGHDTTAWVCQTGRLQDEVMYIDVHTPFLPVKAGSQYVASAYTGAHRCKVDVYIQWFRLDGNGDGQPELSAVQPFSYDAFDKGDVNEAGRPNANNEEAIGGTSLAGYRRIVQAGTAPADAVMARFVLRKWNTKPGQEDSYMFVALAQFEEVAPGVTKPGPWIPTE